MAATFRDGESIWVPDKTEGYALAEFVSKEANGGVVAKLRTGVDGNGNGVDKVSWQARPCVARRSPVPPCPCDP